LLRYAAEVLGVPADAAADLRALVATPWDDLSVGGFLLDSLDLVDVLVAAGEEIGIDLPGLVEEQRLGCMLDLAGAVAERSDSAAVALFCAAWT